MKIAYICSTLANSGGIERILSEKMNYMASKNDVFLITTDNKKKYFYELSKEIKHINLNINYKKKMFIIFTLLNHIYSISRVLKDLNPDVVIVATGKEGLIVPFIKRRIPKIREIHFSKFFRKIQNENKGIVKNIIISCYERVEKIIFSLYNKVIVLTYEDEKKWNLKNSGVIYNFKTIVSNNKSTLKNKKIISVGRLDYQKGFDRLLDAWFLVCKNNSLKDWELEIYGEGPLEMELKEKSRKLGIDKNVFFKGNVKDITAKYEESSLFVLSSRHEGLPLVLIEAMECGLPLVSFDCNCGPKEIIENGGNGFLIENGNVLEMAKKIEEIISDYNLRVRMSERNLEILKKFEKINIMEQWEELIRKIVKEKKE